tara:strand:+ start:500 stop:2008 length:1509 start_codon:yes stop_codon:yes gene_type:complete
MNIKINKTNKIFLFVIIFIYLLVINIIQISYSHWTDFLDMDIVVIYNSLILASGFHQDYLDHPGYTYFVLLSGIYKILNNFPLLDIFNISKILNSTNPNIELQKIYVVSRIFNLFICLSILYLLYRVLRLINLNDLIIFLILIFSSIIPAFFDVNFKLRVEGISVLFYLVSLYFVIKFNKTIKIKYIIFIGVSFLLAYLSKVQIIFHYFSIFFLIPYIVKTKYQIKIKTFKYNLLNLFPTLAILIYLAINTFLIVIASDANIISRLYTNIIVVIIGLIFFSLYLKYLLKYNFEDFLKLNFIIIHFIFGISAVVFSILLLDFLNIFNLNYKIFISLIFPFYHMIQFKYTSNFFYSFNNFFNSLNLYEIFFLTFYCISFLIFTKKNFFKNVLTNFNIFLAHLMFLTSILIIFSNIFRGLYFFYIYIVAIFPLVIYLQNKSKFYILFFLIFLFTITVNVFYKSNLNVYFDKKNNLNKVCYNVGTRSFIKTWNNKFDDNFLNKFCS